MDHNHTTTKKNVSFEKCGWENSWCFYFYFKFYMFSFSLYEYMPFFGLSFTSLLHMVDLRVQIICFKCYSLFFFSFCERIQFKHSFIIDENLIEARNWNSSGRFPSSKINREKKKKKYYTAVRQPASHHAYNHEIALAQYKLRCRTVHSMGWKHFNILLER